MVLFAEGTSSDGNRVLPFRSALVGVVKDAAAHAELGGKLKIQPMSIGYTNTHGIPMGRQHRPLVAWYGDLDFMPHIKEFIARGAVDAVVSYGEPVAANAAADRKAMAKSLEGAVRSLATATLRGRPAPGACRRVLKASRYQTHGLRRQSQARLGPRFERERHEQTPQSPRQVLRLPDERLRFPSYGGHFGAGRLRRDG